MQLSIKKVATLLGHKGSVYALDAGISEHTFFSGSTDKFVAHWNLKTFQAEKFAASGDCNIHVFDLVTLGNKNVFSAHQFSANIVRYSPDGKFLSANAQCVEKKLEILIFQANN